jgi:hypothetical protein
MLAMTTKRLATMFAVAAAFAAAAPAAHAMDNTHAGDTGGCHYTDKDGYDIPIDDGQSVIVDGKTVTCSGGTVVVTATSKSNPTPKPRPKPVAIHRTNTARHA